MNKIEKIGIAGIGPFKEGAVLPIVPGISVLYGRNDTAGGNANAVGKSLVGRVIPSVFYEPEIRADKKSGKRFVSFIKTSKKTKDSVKVSLTSGKNEEVKLIVNGENKSARTKSKTKLAALETWGLTQEEFQTYGLVDAAIPHPLVKGSTSARKAFFTSFFGLDRMDTEKKLFMKELSEIKKVKAAHAEVATAFDAARKDMLSKAERVALDAEIKELEAKVQKLVRLQDKANQSQRVQAFIEVAASQLKKLSKGTPRDSATIKKELRSAAQNDQQAEEYKDYVRAKKVYEAHINGLDMETPLGDLATAAKAYANAVSKIEEFEDKKKPKFSLDKPNVPKTELPELEAEERRLKHALSHSRKFSKGVCETCGQEVKAESPKKLAASLENIEKDIDAWHELATWKKKRKAYQEELEEYEADEKEVSLLSKKLKQLQSKAEAYDKRRVLVKPEKVEEPKVTYDVQALRAELQLAEFVEQNEELIKATENFVPVDFDHSKLAKAQERLYAARASLDLHRTVKKRAVQLRDRLQELARATARQQQLEIILEAYADKAMKKMAIESISAHLMASVNRYASLVFENYSFEFIWGTHIQMIVHRPEGSSDVRMLSGAESMLFTLILILSLLVFVPHRKRLNLLVLDEPTASFSEATQALFVKLLPHINMVIPSVLIITPKTDFKIEGATNFTVVKTPKGSVIKKGQVHEA